MMMHSDSPLGFKMAEATAAQSHGMMTLSKTICPYFLHHAWLQWWASAPSLAVACGPVVTLHISIRFRHHLLSSNHAAPNITVTEALWSCRRHIISSHDWIDVRMLCDASCPPLWSWGHNLSLRSSVGKAAIRPRSLHPDGYLGLLLFYCGSAISYKHLCLIFGVISLVCSSLIWLMLRLVVRWLSSEQSSDHQGEIPWSSKMQ